MSFLDGLMDRLFPADDHPGVGLLGRIFLESTDAKPSRAPLFGPPSSWTQRKPKPTPPDAYAPRIVRQHSPWPHQSWPGGQQPHQAWPYREWPGGGGRCVHPTPSRVALGPLLMPFLVPELGPLLVRRAEPARATRRSGSDRRLGCSASPKVPGRPLLRSAPPRATRHLR